MLLLHGEPSWSFLYRKMIPVITGAGYRVIAPDLVGFGRSDKPTQRSDYTYARHVEWMRATLFDHLDLRGITFVGQDWGGLIGLRLVGEHPDRYRACRRSPTASCRPATTTPVTRSSHGRSSRRRSPSSRSGAIINGGCVSDLDESVIAAYDAPFPDETYKEGARQFPLLVPTRPDDPASEANRTAWKTLEQFDKPFLCAFSDSDPITGGADRVLLERIPGTKGQAAHDDRRRRPLPARGQRRGAGCGRRRLHEEDPSFLREAHNSGDSTEPRPVHRLHAERQRRRGRDAQPAQVQGQGRRRRRQRS